MRLKKYKGMLVIVISGCQKFAIVGFRAKNSDFHKNLACEKALGGVRIDQAKQITTNEIQTKVLDENSF